MRGAALLALALAACGVKAPPRPPVKDAAPTSTSTTTTTTTPTPTTPPAPQP